MAEDVAAFARALDLDAPLICGYSDGGNVALEVGMRFPQLPKALAVGAAWHELSETYVQGVRSALCVGEGGRPTRKGWSGRTPSSRGSCGRRSKPRGPSTGRRS